MQNSFLMPSFEFPSRCLRVDYLLTSCCYLCIKIHIASLQTAYFYIKNQSFGVSLNVNS